ncbi:MAG: extracellular solute-binding protein family 1 [Streptosporangiaceae bacterium]|jgi:alpha-glucoside transport system substrate-binding protein|nr:extracellular solute-binding protein family 1 [Streptosporangiaceae bacterium]
MRVIRSANCTVLAAGLLVSVAGCGGGGSGKAPAPSTGGSLKGVTLEVAAIWTGQEQDKFKQVLAAFSKQTGAKVNLTPTGDNVSTFLGSKVQGGAPPDVAMLPQQGVLAQFADKGWIKPLGTGAEAAVRQNYSKVWQDLGSNKGKLYGVYFKASNKSTIWYRAKAFGDAGIQQPPTSWDQLVKDSGTIADSGTTPFAVAGGDGWTLTDWFENVYASSAGTANYDKLSKHQIKWTDPTVKDALRRLAAIWGQKNFVVGGAIQTDMPTSVTQAFGDAAKAAMVYEGDFVPGVIGEQTKAKVGTDAKFFPFPAVGQQPPVVGGGDAAVVMKDSKGAQELTKYLASPEAARVWAKLGGFTSPNKALDLAAYPDDIQRQIAKSVIDAGDSFRFDMSDLAPAAFGGTKGAGEWKQLQDFLSNPTDVDGAAQKLETEAAKAFKS